MPNPAAGPQGREAPLPGPRERRATVRYPSSLLGSCRTLHARENDLWTARVRDISTVGIGIVLRRRFEPGTVLAVEPLGPHEQTPSCLMVQVVHATAQPGGHWLLGCRFIGEISDDDVQSFR
ncbi:MAG TPA: PilZ domain-containing protein [Gemmataceae bacterium]|nr:PilZ domain-containing protein [Gemmataceae bacterium]